MNLFHCLLITHMHFRCHCHCHYGLRCFIYSFNCTVRCAMSVCMYMYIRTAL